MGEQAHSVFEVQPGLQIIGSSCVYRLDVTGFLTAEVELVIAATTAGAVELTAVPPVVGAVAPQTISVHQHLGKGGGRMHNQMFVKGLGKGKGLFQNP